MTHWVDWLPQGSAELRCEKGADAGSPGKPTTVPTKHAKVRARRQTLDPGYFRGPACVPVSSERTERRVHEFPCYSGRWGLAAQPFPVLLAGGVGLGPARGGDRPLECAVHVLPRQ